VRRVVHGWSWWWSCALLLGCKLEPIEELVIEDEPAPIVMPGIVLPFESPAARDPVAEMLASDAGLLEANELEGTATVQGLVSTLGRVLVLPVRLPWRAARRVELPGEWGEDEEAAAAEPEPTEPTEPTEPMERFERTDG
jgi:uncharacterized protein YbjT (DUF2867 family)